MRALIVGGGIGGLAAAAALQRVGIEVAVFEKAPEIGEVGAGLSLWSNAVLAARRLGIEAEVVAAGSPIETTRTSLSSGKPLDDFDFAALGHKAGAPTVCIHRADLQAILLRATLAADPKAVRTGRECVDWEDEGGQAVALFADGSRERGDILIGADGIHSVLRTRLFGNEALRYAGYYTWRGIADEAGALLPEREALAVIGRGAHGGCFPCGAGRVYWFVTRNGPAGSHSGPRGNRAEILDMIAEWRVPLRRFVEATDEPAILRNDIVDRRPRRVWGEGRVTLLGDAIHATTPNLGQGACQALEDAVVLADALHRSSAPEAGLRGYENRRRDRANFVIRQSRRLGGMFQLANPIGGWLRDTIGTSAPGRKMTRDLFERLLCIDLPELPS